MTQDTFSLADCYKGWDNYQQLLVRALAPLSPEQLTLRAAPHLRSVGVIVTHIISARARWMYYVLQIDDEKLAAIGEWDAPGQPGRNATELVSGLEATWQIMQDALQSWTIADLDEVLRDTGENGLDETFTRQWVLWHLIEHDVHHGGEMSFVLGMHGVEAIDL